MRERGDRERERNIWVDRWVDDPNMRDLVVGYVGGSRLCTPELISKNLHSVAWIMITDAFSMLCSPPLPRSLG